MNKKLNIILIVILAIILIASITYLVIQNKEDEKQEKIFEELENIVTDNTEKIEENEDIKIEENKQDTDNNNVQEEKQIDINKLYQTNQDFIGWLKIKNTNISYPVMQTDFERKDFYLRKNFYGDYSQWGTPYIAEYCNVLNSDNTIIYGHHINGNKMFGELEKYNNKYFYNDHKIINFNTIYGDFNYEIIAVFKTTANTGFKYYNFEKATTENEYKDFINKCKELSIYEIKQTAQYGDKLLTLSTCDYSMQDGRFVIVAKKITK